MEADIAVIGLAVMGQNLILNMADHGFRVAAYNRTTKKVDEFLAGPAQGAPVLGARSAEELVSLLKKPRRVMLMVRAGAVVDEMIAAVAPLLEPGDILIDGGNSHYADTERRLREVAFRGLRYLGVGVSGGEEGARRGPSLMPGGDAGAWPAVREIFQAIAAKTPSGEPCCAWVSAGGGGHFVKMVHNGIEYGDMQLIGEAWHFLRRVLQQDDGAAAETFAEWGRGELDSYLVQITAEILRVRESDGVLLVDRILDVAGQKGTGRWVSESALGLGIPLTLITEAVFARALSTLKTERTQASRVLHGPDPAEGGTTPAVDDVRDALYAAKLVSYAQGFMLLRAAAAENGWEMDFGAIARTWRGGCIIRSAFLDRIRDAYAADSDLPCLLMNPWFRDRMEACDPGWRRCVAAAALRGLPVPALSAALAFYDAYRSEVLPANLLQAQRDYFGAHTFERTDKPRGMYFHHDWIGSGAAAVSGSYSV